MLLERSFWIKETRDSLSRTYGIVYRFDTSHLLHTPAWRKIWLNKTRNCDFITKWKLFNERETFSPQKFFLQQKNTGEAPVWMKFQSLSQQQSERPQRQAAGFFEVKCPQTPRKLGSSKCFSNKPRRRLWLVLNFHTQTCTE